MFTQPENPTQKTRKHAVEAVHRAMTRFPMIVETLGHLRRAEVPCPGDADIHHGCVRAITAILVELARIEPAPAGKATKMELAALASLQDPKTAKLVDPDQLQRMQQFIERILGPHRSPS